MKLTLKCDGEEAAKLMKERLEQLYPGLQVTDVDFDAYGQGACTVTMDNRKFEPEKFLRPAPVEAGTTDPVEPPSLPPLSPMEHF